MKIKLIVTISVISVYLLGASCTPSQDFDKNLGSIVTPYRFSLVNWEFKTLFNEIKQLIFSKSSEAVDESGLVVEYYLLAGRIKTLKSQIEAANTGSGQGDTASLEAELNEMEEQRTALADRVEQIIGRQITETLAQQGIFNPLEEYVRSEISFPPLNFKLEKPPHLLVISPRDRIESIREILLKQETSLEEKENIEAKVDELGVSSLAVTLGGLATYPSFVTDETSLRFTIDGVTEEWLHQYLAFKPLGFLYLLDLTGVSRNYEIATMNETLAGMVGKEIGSVVYQKYYAQDENGEPEAEPESDFYREMREIRRTVDEYLARGEIEQAEQFMEQKRQYLVAKGYYIRKLNQAYFAFYGTYADSPTSISPIGLELKELRNQSASLKDFLNTVAAMTSRQDLQAVLNKN